jgi:hypothetical protein
MRAEKNASSPGIAAPVGSPCVNVCRMEPASGLCEGCLRTIDEIAAWAQLGDDAKRAVWARLGERRALRVARGIGTANDAVPAVLGASAAGGR